MPGVCVGYIKVAVAVEGESEGGVKAGVGEYRPCAIRCELKNRAEIVPSTLGVRHKQIACTVKDQTDWLIQTIICVLKLGTTTVRRKFFDRIGTCICNIKVPVLV